MWWYPSTTKMPNLWQQKPFPFEPEIIEAKTRSNTVNHHISTNFLSPAYDVVLNFKRFFGMSEKPKDDFIVIEDNYNPEIIEAVIV